tara:strand:+ start:116 stop:616 length:501 start_codon:yes stop_codon:yes gene_type:complete
MKFTITRRGALLGAGSLAAISALPIGTIAGSHSTHEVQMLNKDPDNPKNKMLFAPHILTINAGDTVTFIPSDKGHNSESVKGMIPDGAEKWKGKINKEISVTLDVAGFYGFQCKPHVNMGMIGLIVVEGDGKLANLEDAKSVKHRGKAKKAWAKIWEEADAAGLTV